MNPSAIEQIRALRDWYYEFDLGGYKTPVRRPEDGVRHRMRRSYLMEPVRQLFGGNLSGRRVLDLGCNEGYFSLAALEADCQFVLGLDPQQEKLDRARLVFQALEIAPSRYELRCAHVNSLTPGEGPFDLALLFGLLHWLAFPQAIRLIETLAAMPAEVVVIDTVLCAAEGSILHLRREPLGPLDPYRDNQVRILPSVQGLLEMMESFGYRGVVLAPRFSDWSGSEDYRTGVRRGFVFARTLDLTPLASTTESYPEQGQVKRNALTEASWRELFSALAQKTLTKIRLLGRKLLGNRS